MSNIKKVTFSFLLLALSGCATVPTGPSVNVLPAQGKSFDTFRTEDATCRQWAELQMGKTTQDTYDKNVATGAVAGTAIGAGLGAALGSASGHAGVGAAIGAASGLLFGTAAGSNSGQAYSREAQRRYDNAYVQCMYSNGNQVPGYYSHGEAAPPPTVVVQQVVPTPPEVYINEAPQFVFSPALNMYVAAGVPYDLFYDGSGYFYYYGGIWYHGPFYNGPWVHAPRIGFPAVLLRYRIDEIRHFRDLEYQRYSHDREHYDGRIHSPGLSRERIK